MTAESLPAPIYEIVVTAIGSGVEEFTEAGVWIFFQTGAPDELTEFALLHQAEAPLEPIVAGQQLEIDGQHYMITGVGDRANDNIRALGHMVLKANGAHEPELPGEICIEERALPQPFIGMILRVWKEAS